MAGNVNMKKGYEIDERAWDLIKKNVLELGMYFPTPQDVKMYERKAVEALEKTKAEIKEKVLVEAGVRNEEVGSKEKNNGENASNLQLLNDKMTLKRYDSKGHLTEEESRIWSYKTNSFGRMRVEERFTKNVYEYGEDERLSPNVFFYENGELHLMRKYLGLDSYSETLYFDGGFSVELIYENGVKKTEIIYLNNVEQRRREFEY